MLSEGALRLLNDLRQQQPAESLCPDCAGRRLSLPKWDVLKSIRELIGMGAVLCRFTRCHICLEETLVVTVRARPWAD